MGRRVLLAVLSIALASAPAGVALAAFPGADPRESPRVNTPDDVSFDNCEADDETPDAPPDGPECTSYAEERFEAFGFSPDSANMLPPLQPHYTTGTRYTDCDQLDEQGREANRDAEMADLDAIPAGPLRDAAIDAAECLQIAGVRADTAFKYSTGDPGTAVAILDTGIEWQDRELVNKVRLNRDELPFPQGSADHDANDDGVFNVRDYAADSRVSNDAGDSESDGLLDPSDLIARFSDGIDDEPGGGNGYKDDIAGWDFFDDDNDPFDASSCCNAEGHGSDRAKEAIAETDNGDGTIGLCPECQLIPLRVWDTFVVPTDNFAMGTIYAADNGASVVEGAVGGLTNTQFARSAFAYADAKGVALTTVSSDINSANHNYPTNYNEAIYIAGSLYDTAPNQTCGGLPGVPGAPADPPPPPEELEFEAGCQELLGRLGVLPNFSSNVGQPITTSFFRNSNLTQYGGKADVVLMGATGSANTGQAAGAAALLMSYGREELGTPLSGNEVRQLLTMTAEDVLPDNTGTIGLPDRANAGWDSHFGYGRVNLAGAMARIAADRVPPEAQIDAPDWFAPINADRVPAGGVPVTGRALAPHGAGVGAWEIEYACGQDAADSDFLPLLSGSGEVASGGQFGTIPKATIQALADTCNGEVTADAGRPAGAASSAWPADPYPDPDPERHTFQIRLTVHEEGDASNVGRYRKTLHAYADDGNLPGWPRPVGTGSDAARYTTGSGGEASPRLYDVDGDNALDTIIPTSSGELHVLSSDGTPVQSFNGGQPVKTDRYQLELNHPVPLAGAAVPRESLRVPAIGDIDGDRDAEIVVTAGEHLYAWELDGERVFVAGVDRSLSEPCKAGVPKPCFDAADRAINRQNHIKRGFVSSPVLADLDPQAPGLEIVAGSLDQHLYAWKGDGTLSAGFPRKLSTPDADGAEIVTTPAIAELDGDATPEIVVSTNEVAPGSPEFPGSIFEFVSAALAAATGFNPVYAVNADGTMVEGWPVEVGVAAGDLLPFVLPGHDSTVINTDGGTDEVSVSAATSVIPGGGARLVDGAGDTVSAYETSNGTRTDTGAVLNLADFSSAGDVLGTGVPQILKGGLTVNGVVNLLAVNQNLPFNHVQQLWTPASPTGDYVDPGPSAAGYPIATDDFQLVSQGGVARVGEPTSPGARQALVGTGLYQLHAYGPGGVEPAGWPKFTGGWTQATASVGDADGDGDLDVTTLTREGWSFLWDTEVDACDSSPNEEWWTYHHDERSTNNYATDARPPGTPTDLVAVRDGADVVVTLVAPGDDWLCGTPAKMLVNGTERDPAETFRLTAAELVGATSISIRFRDEAGNWGHAASVAVPAAGQSTPTPTPTTSVVPTASPTASAPSTPGPTATATPAPGATATPAPPQARRCASVRRGTPRDDVLRGTSAGERLLGRAGSDKLLGEQGADCLGGGTGNDRLRGGAGRDRLKGGPGRDRLSARGGSRGTTRDTVDCGPGRDVAKVDRRDAVRNCEIVRRR